MLQFQDLGMGLVLGLSAAGLPPEQVSPEWLR